MEEEIFKKLLDNVNSIKMRVCIGSITTLNGSDHHLINQIKNNK
jgi:hypothetical protein